MHALIAILVYLISVNTKRDPDIKVHGANMGPSWDRQEPGGPQIGHVNLAVLGGPGTIQNISFCFCFVLNILFLCNVFAQILQCYFTDNETTVWFKTPVGILNDKGENYLYQPLINSYLGLTRSISWLLKPWLLSSPGHQQPCYWLCKLGRPLSYTRRDFNYLCHVIVKKWCVSAKKK